MTEKDGTIITVGDLIKALSKCSRKDKIKTKGRNISVVEKPDGTTYINVH